MQDITKSVNATPGYPFEYFWSPQHEQLIVFDRKTGDAIDFIRVTETSSDAVIKDARKYDSKRKLVK